MVEDFTDREIKVSPPKEWAVGIPAIEHAMLPAMGDMGPERSAETGLAINHRRGFDCPSCAWADPDKQRPIMLTSPNWGLRTVRRLMFSASGKTSLTGSCWVTGWFPTRPRRGAPRCTSPRRTSLFLVRPWRKGSTRQLPNRSCSASSRMTGRCRAVARSRFELKRRG